MKYVLMSIIVSLSISSVGQNYFAGIKGGMNYTNINSDAFFNATSYRTGINGGFLYDFKLNKNIHFGIEALYTQKGFKNDLVFTDQFGTPTGDVLTTDYDYDYISFPLKTGVEFGNKFSGFVNIAFVSSILVNAKIHIPEWENIIVEETLDMTDKVTAIDFSGLLEVGIGYALSDTYNIFASLSYQVGINSITNPEYFSTSTMKHLGLNSSIGLKYKLK